MQQDNKTTKRVLSPKKKKVVKKTEESKNDMQEAQANYSKTNIIVAVRCRPLNPNEEKLSTVETVKILNGNVISIVETLDTVKNAKNMQTKEQVFFYDIVFDKKSTQKQVYTQSAKFLLEGILDGFNATVMAYGATGSGKTYTMLGTQTEPGIMQRSVTDLFKLVQKCQSDEVEFKLKLSYIEVYNENIHDLLGDAAINLDLREDPNKGVIINGVKEINLDSADNFFSLLLIGNGKRATEVTNNNATSSRSHAVLQIFLEKKLLKTNELIVSRFVLVDLAGSERGSSTGTVVAQRQLEGSKINQSLLNLGKCINALADGKGFISWRDSKLTRILKDSLIGNSRMVMVSTISPSLFSIAETVNTLLYSSRAKNIQVKVKRNTVQVDNSITKYEETIDKLTKELDNLRYQLAVKTHNTYLAPQEKENNVTNKVEKIFKEMAMHFNEEMRLKNEIFDSVKSINNITLTIKEKEFQLFKSINKGNNTKGLSFNSNNNTTNILTTKEKEIKSQINKLNEQLTLARSNLQEKEASYDEFAKKRQTFENQINKFNNDKNGANLMYLFNSYVYEVNNMTNEFIRRQNLNQLKQKELKIQKLLEQLKIRDEYINSEKSEIEKKNITFKYQNENKIKKLEDIKVEKSFVLPIVLQQQNEPVSPSKSNKNEANNTSFNKTVKGRYQSAGHYDYSAYNNPNIIKQKQVFKTKTNEIMNINKKNQLTQLKLNVLNDMYKGSKVQFINKRFKNSSNNPLDDSIVINFDTNKALNKSQSNVNVSFHSQSNSAENSRLGLGIGINDREILNKVKKVMIGKKRISPYMK